VGQVVEGIGLELHALLEVDQVEFQLLRAIGQRGVGDERVQQRRLAGAGAANEQAMHGSTGAEFEVLGVARIARPQRNP